MMDAVVSNLEEVSALQQTIEGLKRQVQELIEHRKVLREEKITYYRRTLLLQDQLMDEERRSLTLTQELEALRSQAV